jgi:hypothetical protein
MFSTKEAQEAYKSKKCPKCGSYNISEITEPLLGVEQKTQLTVHSVKIECNDCGESGRATV